MQEVKEGGQRRHSGASGRARCSPGHSCRYKRCLNPQAWPSPIPPGHMLTSCSVLLCAERGSRCQPNPRLPALHSLPFLLTHPHTLPQQPPPPPTKQDGRPGGRREHTRPQKPDRERSARNRSRELCTVPHQAEWETPMEALSYWGAQSPHPLDFRMSRFVTRLSGPRPCRSEESLIEGTSKSDRGKSTAKAQWLARMQSLEGTIRSLALCDSVGKESA